jgi:glycosyltransferase involved in cell wall biosynthesis
MNFAINASTIRNHKIDGLTRFSVGIINALISKYPEVLIYTGYHELDADLDHLANIRANIREINGFIELNSTLENISRIFWNQYLLPKYAVKDSINVVFSTAPEGSTQPTFDQYITVHDLIPIIYPESSPRLKYYYKFILPKVITASKGIFVTSENTKSDLLNHFKIDSHCVHVIYQGFDQTLFYPLSENENSAWEKDTSSNVKTLTSLPFVLCVAESRTYKNLYKLISAFSKIDYEDLHLLIVGNKTKLNKDLELLPIKLGISNRVCFTGKISDKELLYLYNKALAFIFPSLYEGFGIPPLEAMACGCPIAASKASSIPEVCGDAALYFDPENEESMSKTIATLISSPNILEELSIKGKDRATKFTYSNAADKILEIALNAK